MGWLALTAAALALGLFAAWRYALATNAVYLLDGADRMIAGTTGTRLALAGGSYGPLPAQRLEVTVPDPAPSSPHPVVIFFHGGSWQSGRPEEYRFVGRTLARAGYVVVVAGYRLTPDGVYPRMLEDGAKAAAWTQANISRFGGDPKRVFLMGHSAGAYTAAMLSLERQWLGREGVPEGFVNGMVGLSGPYDFYPFTSDAARAAFGQAAEPALTQPVRFARGDAPPMLLLTGDADTTVKPRNTQALAQAITALGGHADTVTIAGMGHVGTLLTLAAPFRHDHRVLDAVVPFLDRHSHASAPVQARDR